MVKSYKGVQMEQPKTHELPAVTVADYMSTKLITFHPETAMDEVVKSLLKNRISGAPVVNDDGELVGVISEGDCMKEVVRGKYNNMPSLSGKVKDHMSTKVVSIAPEMNIFDAAKQFLDMRIRRFPVVSYGKLLGQISQKDIMRAVYNLKSTTW
ncbi:CBS domain-containing protein [Marinoscillum sp. MHG1-6]|uniref:CBS domain-containing protein n=1 Tax=Marinoscillum sp. MHG1-6 TaxID=2959627 RepID=UPI00215709D8|nr:CBS domain-containing protein [Marinoscillum sp. MHG1-6]